MRHRNPWLAFVPVIGLLVSPTLLRGLNQSHLDLDSLTYLSTDLVLATLSVDAPQRFTATVTESLYGSLRPGEKLATLSDFLMFFAPMEDEQRVILFLDRRPRSSRSVRHRRRNYDINGVPSRQNPPIKSPCGLNTSYWTKDGFIPVT
jgi:hypothetical protein